MFGRFLVLALVAPALLFTTPNAGVIALAPSHGISAPTILSAAVSAGSEADMLVSKLPGGWIFVGDTAGVHRSNNNGASWSHNRPLSLGGLFSDGYALAQDDMGRLYASTTQGQVINVASSTNNGLTWSTSPVAVVDALADRPWIVAHGDGQLTLIYNAAPAGTTAACSTDRGVTWTGHSVVPGAAIAGNVARGENGAYYYAAAAKVYRLASVCAPTTSAVFLPAWGAQIQTQLAVAGSAPHIYVAAPTTDNSAMQVRGLNGFTTIGQKVITVSPGSYKSNTFGAIASATDDSQIAVAWYGTTTAGDPSSVPASATWDLLVTRVTNFWSATPTITTTLVESDVKAGAFCLSGVSCSPTSDERDLLDYIGVDFAPDGSIHTSYGHDEPGVAVASIHHARLP